MSVYFIRNKVTRSIKIGWWLRPGRELESFLAAQRLRNGAARVEHGANPLSGFKRAFVAELFNEYMEEKWQREAEVRRRSCVPGDLDCDRDRFGELPERPAPSKSIGEVLGELFKDHGIGKATA